MNCFYFQSNQINWFATFNSTQLLKHFMQRFSLHFKLQQCTHQFVFVCQFYDKNGLEAATSGLSHGAALLLLMLPVRLLLVGLFWKMKIHIKFNISCFIWEANRFNLCKIKSSKLLKYRLKSIRQLHLSTLTTDETKKLKYSNCSNRHLFWDVSIFQGNYKWNSLQRITFELCSFWILYFY